MTRPLIFDMARGSFEDGPGVRTVVFFKGCPLSCAWCHNPESQRLGQETFFFPERCIGCGECERGGKCIANARRVVGRYIAPGDLVREILKDKLFFDASDGGVTLSGGEPLLFISYLGKVLPKLKDEGVHVAVQTCGHFDFDELKATIARYIDLIYFDLKIFDAAAHEQHTGRTNRVILENLQKLLELGIELVPRIPLVPGVTATERNLSQLADHLSWLGVKEVEILFHNPASREKLDRLGRTLPAGYREESLPVDEQQRLMGLFEQRLGRRPANRVAMR
jgi:pyruvate formate lyase activating enzyme